MKKVLSLLLTTMLIMQIPICAYANDNSAVNKLKDSASLTMKESQMLSLIEKTVNENEKEIEILKSNGVFDDFLDEVNVKMEKYISENTDDIFEETKKWDIYPESTVFEIKERAQDYLNKHFDGIEIGSDEFDAMVHAYLDNEDMGTSALVNENPDFGPLYLYMCIYSMYVLDKDNTTVECYGAYQDDTDIENLAMSDIAYTDGKENFIDTVTPQILSQYVQTYSTTSTAWPKMNGTKIQTYAQTYAKSYNTNYIGMDADCTNFASQALFYGSLPMTYTSSDKTTYGYIETTTRWFHFKTNASKYSISTSWIRVVELYDYLSPHYAVYETSSGSNMTPYLNKGFLLQGKQLIGKYKHSVIVTINNGNVQYCAHSSDRKNESIQTFYNGFSKYRVVQTY